MFKTSYLYGVEPHELSGMEYFSALELKKERGTRHYRKLFLKHDRNEEEDKQLFFIGKALHHTQKLLDERTE